MPMLPNLIRSESLAQQGYSTIRRAIRDGKIPRGQLFSESSLAASLGVSRTPVREALLNLYQDGVVEIVPKRGYRLAELDDAAIDEIRLLRVALEQVVVKQLCARATAADIQELRAILKGRRRTQQDMFGIDEAFHLRMAELAGLNHIHRVLLGLRGKMYLIASGTRVPALRNEDVVREHHELVDLIERRDCERALNAVTEHVERSVEAFVAARSSLVHDPATLQQRPVPSIQR